MDLDEIQFENAVEMELPSENPELWTVDRVSSTVSYTSRETCIGSIIPYIVLNFRGFRGLAIPTRKLKIVRIIKRRGFR